MIRSAILSALSSACHGAGEAFANLMPEPAVDAAAMLDWGAQSLFSLAGVLRRCCEEPECTPPPPHGNEPDRPEHTRYSQLDSMCDYLRKRAIELEKELSLTWRPWPPLVRDSRPIMTGVVDWCRTTADTEWTGSDRFYREIEEQEACDAQPAGEERAELVERIAAQRRRIGELEDELSRARDGYVTAEMHEDLRQSLLAVSRERDEARAECGQFRAALERAERSINSQTDEAETRALEAEDRADKAEKRIAGLEDDAKHYVQAIEELTRRAESAERDLSRASYWKRGEPGEPKRWVVRWNSVCHETTRASSTLQGDWLLPGWYAEALGAPPSEEEKP